jgi:hypothetical protein
VTRVAPRLLRLLWLPTFIVTAGCQTTPPLPSPTRASVASLTARPDETAIGDITRAASPGPPPPNTEAQQAVTEVLSKLWIKEVTWSRFVLGTALGGSGAALTDPFGPEELPASSFVYVVIEQGQFRAVTDTGEARSGWLAVVRESRPPYHVMFETGWDGTGLPGWFVALPDMNSA